uniref:Uncharacterized protein n=1 Tax=Tetranychus urticae TaxID=32264 RepID=T1JTK4_TETUR
MSVMRLHISEKIIQKLKYSFISFRSTSGISGSKPKIELDTDLRNEPEKP